MVTRTDVPNYDGLAEEYSVWVQTCFPHRYDKVLSFLPQRANRALDVGCGSGDLCLLLVEHFRHVVGIDISRSMISLAKKCQAEQRKENVDFLVADFENLPFGEPSFDFVVSFHALYYTRLDVTLPRLRRLVKPGGRMVLHSIVNPYPRLYASPAVQVLSALMSAPGYARSYGLRMMWRLVSFRANPAWLRHMRVTMYLTPEAFQDIYGDSLPGCEFERHDLGMTAFWEAPGATQPEAGSGISASSSMPARR